MDLANVLNIEALGHEQAPEKLGASLNLMTGTNTNLEVDNISSSLANLTNVCPVYNPVLDRNKINYHSDKSSDISLDESETDVHKPPPPRLLSVLAQPLESRQEDDKKEKEAILNIHRADKKVIDRNKRMFGMLMGTLKRFKTEENDREKITVKRSKVDEKVCLAVEEERASFNKQSEDISEIKEKSLIESGFEETRLDLVSNFNNWEKSNKHLCNFIQTETKPKILWLPKEHNAITNQRLKETRDYFNLCVAERTAKFKKEIEELDKKRHKSLD